MYLNKYLVILFKQFCILSIPQLNGLFIPLTRCLPLIQFGVTGGLEPIQAVIGRELGGGGTPWTARQSIARLTQRGRQPFTLTVTPMANLE